MRDMGASVTLETVSPAVEGSSDNRHTGSGASVDTSLLDLSSSGNVSLPVKSLETMERQALNMVIINSNADLFATASVKSLQSENLYAPLL